MVNNKKEWIVMNHIWHQMKKRSPFSGQNGQLVHWWLLVHSGPFVTSSFLARPLSGILSPKIVRFGLNDLN
jgi:hypothetical protein